MEDCQIQELEKRKKYLKRYKKNLALIDRLENKLLSLDERIYGLRSVVISDMPKGGTPITLDDLLSDKQDLTDRINKLNLKKIQCKREILEKIDSLEEVKHAEVLEAFFIDCKDFDQIAEELGYTKRHVIRLYSEAILLLSF